MDELRQQVEGIRETQGYIEKKIDDIKKQFHSIRTFFFGDKTIDPEVSKGFIHSINKEFVELKDCMSKVEGRLGKIENAQIKNSLIVRILWGVCGTTAGLIAAYLISLIK